MTAPATRRPAAPPASPPLAAASAARPARLALIDLLRGLVIAIMVLDHVREYFSNTALVFQPTDLAQTTPALFFTRWITHLCAPTFVLLAGASAYLQRDAARTRGAGLGPVARFLLTRGAWLVVLEATAVSFALNFDAPFVLLEVIWAIGVGLMTLAALLWLPPAAVLALGVLAVAGHQALASLPGASSDAWRLPFGLGPLPAALGIPGVVAYPALPWAGVLWMGYGIGHVFTRPERDMRRALVAIGAGALALFAVLRAVNGYGDPAPWSPQPRGAVYTALSVLNVSKYPPSLLFVLLTLGISLPLGAALDAAVARSRARLDEVLPRFLLALGRTPLFTFLVHLYLVHGLAMLVGVLLGVPAAHFTNFVVDSGRLRDAGWGVSLPVVYAIWLLVLVALYPLARSYATYRERRRAWWLRYL